MRIRCWSRKRIRGSVPQTKGDFKKSIECIFLIILKAFFFVFILLVSDVLYMSLDTENHTGSTTGSGALGLTGDVWHQKYKNKKEGVYCEDMISTYFGLLIFLSGELLSIKGPKDGYPSSVRQACLMVRKAYTYVARLLKWV